MPYSTSSSGSRFRSTTRIKHLKITSAGPHLWIYLKHSHLFNNNSLRVFCYKIMAWCRPCKIQPNSSTILTFSKSIQWFSSLKPLSRITINFIKPSEMGSRTQVQQWYRCSSSKLWRQRNLSIWYQASRLKMRDSRISRHPSKSWMRDNSQQLHVRSPKIHKLTYRIAHQILTLICKR